MTDRVLDLRKLKSHLEYRIQTSENRIAGFIKKMSESKNFAHTLTWETGTAMSAAVCIEVCNDLLRSVDALIERGDSPRSASETIYERVLKIVAERAAMIPASTLVASNEIEKLTTSEWAYLLGIMRAPSLYNIAISE